MKNRKKVSIIVPAYNVEKYVNRCINSLIKQTYPNIEIIVVDDGSTDNTLVLCTEVKNNNIKIYHKENGGLSSARNYGIEKSTGDYITFVDSDDDVDNHYIEVLVDNLEKNNVDISMCGRKTIYTYKGNIDTTNSTINNIILDCNMFLEHIDDPSGYGSFVCGKLYKREYVTRTMFDESIYMYEDNLFSLKICTLNPSFYYEDRKLYNYYVRNDSLSRKKFDERKATGIDSLSKTIDICDSFFPNFEKKYVIKKIKSLIWFKSSTNQKKYIKLINKELKKCNIWNNFYLNGKIPVKERFTYFFKNKFSIIFNFLIYKK